MDYGARRIRLLAELEIQKVAGMWITDQFNVFYLTGFRGVNPHEQECMLFVSESNSVLFVSRLYEQEAKKIVGLKVVILQSREMLLAEMKGLLQDVGQRGIGFEADNLRFSAYERLKSLAGDVAWKPLSGVIQKLRIIKDAEEIQLIEKAAVIADTAFEKLKLTIMPGMTEKQVARKLDEFMEDLGSEKPSFDTIVAVGKNTALPHYRTGNEVVAEGLPLLFDFGATVEGYCSDTTKMLVLGKPSGEYRKVMEIVNQAKEAAKMKLRDGVTGEEVHAAAVKALGEYKDYFVHTIGHGVGLEVHEGPQMYWGVKDVLREGMVVTIEPGVYLSAKFGVRLEDLVVVTGSGYKEISEATS